MTSTLVIPNELSERRRTFASVSSLPFAPLASEKAGQPQPDSNLLSDLVISSHQRKFFIRHDDTVNDDVLIHPFKCFFGIEGHVSQDRNPGLGYNTLL